MARIDEYLLSQSTPFQQRAISSIIDYIVGTIFTECPYDLQTITVTGSPTSGTFTLSGGPLLGTVTLPWNSTPGQVQLAINSVFSGTQLSCLCLGTVLPAGSVMVIWIGSLSQQPQNVMTVSSNNLAGGSTPTPSVAHTITGVANSGHPLRSTLANKIMSSPSTYMTNLSQLLASNSAIQTDYLNGQSSGSGVETQVTDAHIDSAVASQFNLWCGAY